MQLYQVVLNLIVNGLETLAEQEPGNRWLRVRATGSNASGVELTVEDSGKRIVESELAQAFEPFFTTKPEGLGMGLSITRSIAQAHGRRLMAGDRADGRAIFWCVLPAAQQIATATR